MTLFEQCCEAAYEAGPDVIDRIDWEKPVVRAVLTTVLNNTGSPRTVEEIERILAEAG